MQGTIIRAHNPMPLFAIICIVSLFLNIISTSARAQETKDKAYLPHLADLMNEAMQVHHVKLWFAGHANNWMLAGYEVKKLKETIEEIKETIVVIQSTSPQWQRVPVGEMLAILDGNLVNLDQAIKATDAAKFEIAYHELTATCNACHVRAGQPQIKIMRRSSE